MQEDKWIQIRGRKRSSLPNKEEKIPYLLTPYKRREICSYGIILFTILPKKEGDNSDFQDIRFLIGKRRDSIAYSEFVKGNLFEEEIPKYIKLMSVPERQRLLEYKNNLPELWKDLNMSPNFNMEPTKELLLKFHIEYYKGELSSKEGPLENTWGFPKGRKNSGETELECCLREMEEETSIHRDYVTILNKHPYCENYKGTDNRLYKSVYYVAYIPIAIYRKIKKVKLDSKIRSNTISNEIETLKWVSIHQSRKKLDMAKSKILFDLWIYLMFDFLPGKTITSVFKDKKNKRRKSWSN